MRVRIEWTDRLAISPIAFTDGRDTVIVGGSPPPPAPVELLAHMRGPQGLPGPPAPEPDLPDFTLIFDNRLV